MPRIKQPQLEAFATLSGDYNPVHLDSEFAKNSYFGAQIVYGIYQVFYALNHALKSCKQPYTLESIQANFHAPLFINTPFSLKVEKHLESSDIQAADLKQTRSQGEVSCDDFRGCVGASKGVSKLNDENLKTPTESRHSKISKETARGLFCDEKTELSSENEKSKAQCQKSSDIQAVGFSDDVCGFQTKGEGSYLEGNDRALSVESTKAGDSQGEVSCDDFRGCVGASKGDKAQSLSPKRVANSSKSAQETSRFIGGGGANPLLPPLHQRSVRE